MAKSFSEWYQRNKDEFNAKRRAEYKSNPELREKAKRQQAAFRESNPRKTTAGEPIYREVDGVKHQVLRVGAVAAMIGRTEQVIRLWERRGLIPRPTVKSAHRYYTLSQVALLQDLASFMDDLRGTPAGRGEALMTKKKEIELAW